MTLVVAAGAAALPATAANARSYPGAAPEDPSLVEADVPGLDRGDGSPKPSASPEGVPAAVGVRLLDAPVNRRDDTRAHKYIVDHVHPGTTIRRRIVVENVSPVKRLVDVYPAAADVTEKGFVLAPDRTQNELSSWIEVDKTQVKLGSDDEATVWVTIRVPKKAEAGERYAVVWAQSTSGNDRMVEQIARAGIRVYLSVGPGGEPPSGFEVGPLSGGREADGTPFVTTEVRNTGQRALDLAGELRLTDGPSGLAAGPLRAEARTLPLAGRTTIRVKLDRQLPDGPWKARLDLASGWTKRTATGSVDFGKAPAPATATAKKFDAGALVLGSGVAGSLLILLLFGVYTHRRRFRQPVTG
ncbi:hypothetical protein ACIA47_12315 [Micromonospora sp. NPDC051227]|uniref:hypothetical protein n=1 Tax=Micromonospora sp. NPDC051227 TaxID=3364285 RepID=UPI0037996BC7